MKNSIGNKMYNWAKDIFPINRSLTGDGTRETLNYFKAIVPEMEIFEVPSGKKVFDWIVPNEWNVKEAWVKDETGNKIIDFSKNNLHLMGYSTPVNKKINLNELQEHLYSLPEQPSAIPYITSYYKERWGFCLKEIDRKKLKEGTFEVFIDSTLEPGDLVYGEVILPGSEKREILLSTYVCHPSMANNELSGPVVATAIINWIKELKERKYTYRIIFIPETIGSLVYLEKNYKHLQKVVDAGFVLTCIGDNNSYSMLESRLGNTLADKVSKHILKYHCSEFIAYSFLERGSDERQYCAPGIDLPVCGIMRSKYGTYSEYHTSLDDLNYISPEGLEGGYNVVKKCLLLLENNHIYKTKVLGEPQLDKRGLYPTISTKNSNVEVRRMMNFIAYADGSRNLIEIADLIEENALDLIDIAQRLLKEDVVDISFI
jgi:aminopeptidase-like protein